MLQTGLAIAVEIAEEQLYLHPQRAIYWPAKNTLIIADLHLGKVNHFRRAGVPVPVKANTKNIETLVELLRATQPHRVLFLGDLFHSHYNDEWEVLGQVVKHFVGISFELILGNHDILSLHQYQKHGIVLHNTLSIQPFLFTHHPQQNDSGDLYNLAGHLHPGVRLMGKAKQSLTLPCFYFGAHQGLLPAFGAFTGLARIEPKKGDQVFVIVENKILRM